MPFMSNAQIDEFMNETRVGVLCTNNADGSPNAVPVWFEWQNGEVRIFTSAVSEKMARFENDPRVSFLVARPAGEPEQWVAVDGVVSISAEGAVPLLDRLGARYWDEKGNPQHAATLAEWRQAGEYLRVLTIVPQEVRSYTV
jgi:PPOX class probable F420-dependent enzyme